MIKTYALIPCKICPEEQLPTKYLKSTTWETAKVPLGLVCIPIIAPVFFGMPFVEANIHDSDFNEKLALLSPTHLAWAKLVKENINQQENDGKDYDKIIGRISKAYKTSTSKYVTPNTFGVELLDAPIIHVFTLPKDKWKEAQEELRTFFKCNLSPVHQPRPSSTSPISSPIGVTFATNVQAATPIILLNANASQQMAANNQQPFNPMTFMQQFATQMMAVQQRSQTIVVESCEDKTHESEAKFNNNMLQLLLVGGAIDFASPGSFVDPRIAKYT